MDLKVLAQFEEFKAFKQTKSPSSEAPPTESDTAADQTPEEQIDHAHSELQAALAAEVLDRVYEKEPTFFEQLVLDVLQAMGYGGSETASVQHLGKSGDEGIDGVIREDELGLDLIYVQAKRWANPVGRPEIQKFSEPSPAREHRRASSSQPPPSRRKRRTTLLPSRPASCSSTEKLWPAS